MANRYRPLAAGAVVTSTFGPRWGTQHRGMDFGKDGGSGGLPVYAAQSGTVVYAGAASGFGGPDPAGWVVIDHPASAGGGTTVYGHIIRQVKVGDYVQAGSRIGFINPDSGTNGGVASHLHFEVHPTVWQQGSQIDPAVWLKDAATPNGQPAPAAPKPVSAQAPMVYTFGVDVSEFQNGMSLAQAAKEGITYAIIRTTDGTYRDGVYSSHFDDAKSAGLVIMAYHYLRNPAEGSTVAQQVKASLEVMGTRRAPIWLDCETPRGLHIDHIREAKRLFEAAGVRVLGVYSYVPFWEGKVAPSEPDTHSLGKLWVAAYGADRVGNPADIYPGNANPQWDYPLGNQKPMMWQFGSKGRVAGHLVDINAYRGSVASLRSFVTGVVEESRKPTLPVPPTPAPANPAPVTPNNKNEVRGNAVMEGPYKRPSTALPASISTGTPPAPPAEAKAVPVAATKSTRIDRILGAMAAKIAGSNRKEQK